MKGPRTFAEVFDGEIMCSINYIAFMFEVLNHLSQFAIIHYSEREALRVINIEKKDDLIANATTPSTTSSTSSSTT